MKVSASNMAPFPSSPSTDPSQLHIVRQAALSLMDPSVKQLTSDVPKSLFPSLCKHSDPILIICD
jgi:hypothetical protein